MRDLDLVLLGVTGFTGRQTARWVARYVSEAAARQAGDDARPPLRWALAARHRGKLEAVRADLGPDFSELPLLVCDTGDDAAVTALARRTRVLLTTVGPYAQYGSAVVAACAAAGTDYVDITGETPWVRDMIDAHQATALRTGARLVPCCGFDSVPSDLGVWLVARALQGAGTDPVDVRASFSAKGGFNGGTLASGLGMMASGEGRRLFDPFLLNPPERKPGPAADRSQDVKRPYYDDVLGSWAAPFLMAAINTRVVRRSDALFSAEGQGYGPDFAYREVMRSKGRSDAWLVSGALGVVTAVGMRETGRKLLKRVGPAPGQGPSEAAMDGGFFRTRLVGRGASGVVVKGEISGPGDPGNRATVRMLCSAALALVEDRERLPERAGFLTPATCFEQVLVDRLRDRGMTLSASVVGAVSSADGPPTAASSSARG